MKPPLKRVPGQRQGRSPSPQPRPCASDSSCISAAGTCTTTPTPTMDPKDSWCREVQLLLCQLLLAVMPDRVAGTSQQHSPISATFSHASVSPSHRGHCLLAKAKPRCHFPQHHAPCARTQPDPCATNAARWGPWGTWCAPSVPDLSLLGWLCVPSPTGCPRPCAGCAGMPRSYSQRLELGTGMGTFLNRGPQFTCTRTERGGPGFPPQGMQPPPRHKVLGSAPTVGHGNQH